MKVRIPASVARYWDRIHDWVNVDVVSPVRRIDVVLTLWGVGTVGYYTWAYGWLAGFYAAVLYGVMLLTGFFMRDYL